MTIENLIKAVPPPSHPTYAFDGPWEAIEAEIGTELPQDYKDLVRLYGSGRFLEWIDIYNPLCPSYGCRLIPEVYVVQQFFLEYAPEFPMYPQPGGLLACGSTNTGEYILWLTRGPVLEWPIVVWDHDPVDDKEIQLFECDLTDYLAGVVTRDLLIDEVELGDGETAFKSDPDPWPEEMNPA
jgi:hypothetical protein